MKLFSTSLLLGAACCVAGGANAALVAHYTFDADGTASAGTDATLGEAASIDNTNFVAGGGSLLLDPTAITTDTAGADGAVGGDVFDWSGSDVRTVAFFVRANSTQVDTLGTMISLGSGTGGGRILEVFVPRAKKAIGFDINADMLALARTRLENPDLSHCQLRPGDVTSLPLPSGEADVVIMHQVLHFHLLPL